MYVMEYRGYGQVDDVDVTEVASVPATYPMYSANAPLLPVVGILLSFTSTLMLFTVMMSQRHP